MSEDFKEDVHKMAPWIRQPFLVEANETRLNIGWTHPYVHARQWQKFESAYIDKFELQIKFNFIATNFARDLKNTYSYGKFPPKQYKELKIEVIKMNENIKRLQFDISTRDEQLSNYKTEVEFGALLIN